MTSSSLHVPLSAPAPGREALARARRIVHEGGPTRRDLFYRAYVSLLVGGVLGVPVLTGLTSVVPADRVAQVVWMVRMCCALPLVLAALAPTHLGPVITSDGELHYLVEGPFGARRVLAGRTWTVLVAALSATTVVMVTVCAGLGLGGVEMLLSCVWMMGQTALTFAVLLGVQTRFAAPVRVVGLLCGVATVVVLRLAAVSGGAGTRADAVAGSGTVPGLGGGVGVAARWALGGGADLAGAVVSGVLTLAVVAAVPLALGAVPARVLAHDLRVRHLIRTGLGSGDSGVLAVHDGPPRRRLRGRTLGFGSGGPVRRALSVDTLDLLRTPGRVGAALVVVLVCGVWAGALGAGTAEVPTRWLTTSPGDAGAPMISLPVTALAPVVLVGAQWSFTRLTRALSNVVGTLGVGRLDRSSFPVVIVSHLLLPGLLHLVATAVGLALGAACAAGGVARATPAAGSGAVLAVAETAGVDHAALLWAATGVVVLAAPLASLTLIASASPPLALLAPAPTAFGDSSSLLVVAWMLRALVPAGFLGVVLAAAGALGVPLGSALSAGVGVLVPACAVAAGWRLRSLSRLDRYGLGGAPSRD